MTVERLKKDSIDLLREMIAIPSPSFEEEKVAALISSRLFEWGITHKLVRGNIVALHPDFSFSKKTLALDAHMDTVSPASTYTRDPFDSGSDTSTVWGLGSNDDGGSVVSMIAAFRHFLDKELSFNLMLILSREEERSGEDGTRHLFAPGGPFDCGVEFPMPDWTIVGEPTQMRAATSERGLLVLDGEAHGISGHAARGEGVNALYIAMEDIMKLRSFTFDRHSDVMGDVKLNVTQISAGTAHNVIPDICKFVVDIRPTEKYDNPEILEMLQRICKSTLKARNLQNSSSVTFAESPLLKTAEALGIETFSSPTTSDWVRIKGDCIKMGPGDSARSHKADEYILTEEIGNGIDTYIKFIDSFYGNTVE